MPCRCRKNDSKIFRRQLSQKLDNFISPDSGTVSLYYVSSVAPFISHQVTEFFLENPSSHITFQFLSPSNLEMQDALIKGDADLGLGLPCGKVDGLKTHRLGVHELVLIVPDRHPLSGQKMPVAEIKKRFFAE